MTRFLKIHRDYRCSKTVLYNENNIIKTQKSPITNGVLIEGQDYVEMGGAKILVPSPLHPAIFSAVHKNDTAGPYLITTGDRRENGPFFEVDDTVWIQQYVVTLHKLLNGQEDNKALYRNLEDLERIDSINHGRIGEALYVFYNMIRAKKQKEGYRSASLAEYKGFINSIKKYLDGDVENINDEYFNNLPDSLKEGLSSFFSNSAISSQNYIKDQFPAMTISNNLVSYYKIGQDTISPNTIPRGYFKAFNKHVAKVREEMEINQVSTENTKLEVAPVKGGGNHDNLNATIAISSATIFVLSTLAILPTALVYIFTGSTLAGLVFAGVAATSVLTGLGTYTMAAREDRAFEQRRNGYTEQDMPRKWKKKLDQQRQERDLSENKQR